MRRIIRKVVMNNTDKPRRPSRGRDTREERDPRRENSPARREGRPARQEAGAPRREGATSRRDAGTFARDGGPPAASPYVMAAVRLAQVSRVLAQNLLWEKQA